MTSREKSYRLEPFVADLAVGEPVGHQHLTLVPLAGGKAGQLSCRLAGEALATGTLRVSEVSEGGHVPELAVVNDSTEAVLLLDGEELVGAKQNRILNTSVLVPPGAKVVIPVSCVEQGRWDYRSADFASGEWAPSALRACKSRDVGRSLRERGRAESDQAAVWQQVEACLHRTGAQSRTRAMHDAVQQRRPSLDGYRQALRYPAGARGLVAAIDGQFVAVDLFDQPAVLERIWDRLLTGYALDAIGRSQVQGQIFSAKGAAELLRRLATIDCQPCPSVGCGQDWRFETEDLVGQALVAEDVCVHLCAFPADREEDRQEPSDLRIMPPSYRRRGRGSGADGVA